jgi:hypothetical protein
VPTYDARKAQQPPPEEVEALPVKVNAQVAFAARLSAAFNREEALRQIRVCDRATEVRPPSTDEKGQWKELARRLMREGINDPERFMHAAFTTSVAADDTLAHGLFSNALWGKSLLTYVEQYRKYCEHADAQLEEAWQADARTFKLALIDMRQRFPEKAGYHQWHSVLTNGFYTMSPLFKYCIAAAEGIAEVCMHEYEAAVVQFLGDPTGYQRVWKDRIPEAFIRDAERVLGITGNANG